MSISKKLFCILAPLTLLANDKVVHVHGCRSNEIIIAANPQIGILKCDILLISFITIKMLGFKKD